MPRSTANLVAAHFQFQSGPLLIESLQRRLQEITGIEIEIQEQPEDGLEKTHFIHFKSVTEDFHTIVTIQNHPTVSEIDGVVDGKPQNITVVSEGALRIPKDQWNRCPKYSLCATIVALRDLGGTARLNWIGEYDSKDELPPYGSFANWKKLNKGLSPTWWRIAIGWISIGLSVPFILLYVFLYLAWCLYCSDR